MEWLNIFLSEQPFTLAIPVLFIFFVFIYAMRQAHFKHVARVKEINDRYTVHSISSSDG